MGILAWILFGLVVGIIAKLLMPGRDPGGFIVTILLGIAGALVGGSSGARWACTARKRKRRLDRVHPGRDHPAGAVSDDGPPQGLNLPRATSHVRRATCCLSRAACLRATSRVGRSAPPV